jgi:uncharacterized protein
MKFKTLLIVVALLSLILAAGCTEKESKTLSSSGTATLTANPDEAYVTFAVETLADSADESRDENAQIVDNVLKELYKLNVPRDNIETQNFNIYEEFDWTNNMRVSNGYKTSHNVRVLTTDFSQVGDIIDAAVGAGATRVQSISYELSNAQQRIYKQEALASASRDAREKAEAIASGLNAEIGDIISVSTQNYNYYGYPIAFAEDAVGETSAFLAARTEISPQKLEVTANVEVVFAIK